MDNDQLSKKANELRLEAVKMVYNGGDGHPGPALAVADIVTVLFYHEMRIDPKNPQWEDRDRFILSKGHACPILYAALSDRGYYGAPVADFKLRGLGSIFQGHPVMAKTPGVDMTSGSLGNGLPIGAGMAYAAKHLGKDFNVFVIVGDGEIQEGVVWEGANFAAARNLDNLILFVDRNDWQSGDTVEKVIGSNNPGERFAAFRWHVQEVDGHDAGQLIAAIAKAKNAKGKPSVIVCNTVKGKGCDFMENDNAWHKGVPTDEQYRRACECLGGK